MAFSVTINTSTTYWAREDSTTANNNELNPIGTSGGNGVPAFPITFTGDPNLNFNSGATDPNTMVVIGGISYPFTVEVVGTLKPLSTPGNINDPGDKVPDVYQGQTVVVISYFVNGVEHELFFIPGGPQSQTLMNQFAASAIPLDTFVLTCFCEGTNLLAPNGLRAVEDVRVGDFLLNDRGELKQVIWTGMSEVEPRQMRRDVNLCPVRIPAGALGNGLPERDLLVSSQHRIVVEGHAPSLLFGEDRVLVPAKHLLGSVAERVMPDEAVRYYHVLFEDHELVVSEGLASESFQPARRTLDVMSSENQERLLAAIDALGAEAMLTRLDALPSLNHREGLALGEMLTRATRSAPEARSVPASRQEKFHA